MSGRLSSHSLVSSIEHANICFLGTSVESGAATAVIVATGTQTYFGRMASSLAGPQIETAFDKGVKICLVDALVHAGDGADGFLHQRPLQTQLEGLV